MNTISRKKFLNQNAVLAAAAILAPLASFAKQNGYPAKKIKVGVIGCGSVSNMYFPHLAKSPYVELAAACDIIIARAKDAAEKYAIPAHYQNIEDMLNGVPFDLLINLTDMQVHGMLNKQALVAGKHVWSEKPMANSYSEGKALLDLAKQRKLHIWGAPAVVNSPQFAFMSKMIQEGKMGKVSAAHGHYGHMGPTWSSFFYEKLGGSLPDLGVYNIATLTGLLGPAKAVTAMTSIVTPERTIDHKGKVKVEVEDNAMVLMDHGNGVISHVQCGFNYFDPHGHEGKGQESHTVTIWGTHGNMGLVGYDWAPFGVDMATHDHETRQRFVPDPEEYVWQEGASVVSESLLTKMKPLIDPEHALHVLEIIEAARTSSEKGEKVALQSAFQWPMV